MYSLKENIYYQKYTDKVYLRDVNTQKDYLFNEIVADILNILKKETSFEDLVTELKQQYDVPDEVDFESDICEFLMDLNANGLIYDTDNKQEDELDSLNIIKEVRDLCEKQHLLVSVGLELTYRCNEKCKHCYVDDPIIDEKKELTFKDYKNVIDQVKELGCSKILVTGGEPTLKNCFVDICRYIKELGIILDIYTNGLHFTDELFDEICDLKPNSVSVSMYAGDAETHDAITNVKGSFDKTLKTVMALKCAGIDTYIKTVVISDNFNKLEKLLKLGKRLNIPVNPAFQIIPSHSGVILNDLMINSDDEYHNFVRLFKKYENRGDNKLSYNKQKRNLNGAVCLAGVVTLSINPYGDIFPCNSLPILLGNVKEVLIKDVWENSEEIKKLMAFKFKNLDKKCETCKYSSACTVCLGASYVENNGEFKPCKYTCAAARARCEESATIENCH